MIGHLGEMVSLIGWVAIPQGATCVDGPALGLLTVAVLQLVSRLCCAHCISVLQRGIFHLGSFVANCCFGCIQMLYQSGVFC